MLLTSRKTRALTAALAVVTALAVCAASAAANAGAKFFGVVPQSVLTQEEFNTLQQGGVKTMRVPISWGQVQPKRGGAYEWGSFDPLVERAAKSGIELLPFVIGTPTWAVPNATVPGTGAKAPARLPATGTAATAWSAFLKAAVARYSAGGTYWAENPLVPQIPVTAWQIWNEPNFKYFVAKPNPTEYGKLVKISSAAIKSVEPSAQVVLAGLFAKPAGGRRLQANGTVANKTSPNWFAAYFLEQMYKTNPGIKSRFQGVALHPYVARYRQLPAEIEETRKVLTREGDGSKPLWITELGWSSEPPQGPSNVFAVGASGQARELKGAFTLLKQDQVKFRIAHVYWFSVDDAAETCNFCNGSGLFRKGFIPKKSWTEFVKFTGGTP